MLRRLCDTKVIRTRFEVTRYLGSEAGGLKSDLADVPYNAKLIEVDEMADGGVRLTFLVEVSE